jgi:uncharacterized protein DUF4249
VVRSAGLTLLLLVAGCEIEKVGIPRTEARIALHGVLSATASSQVVLLERTRTGSVAAFDLGDPFLSSEVAETDAVLTLTSPSGQVFVAVEDKHVPANRGRGLGMYRFSLPGGSLERGDTYRLSVVTAGGDQLSAETAVPEGIAASVAEQRVFDRGRDTVLLEWPASPGARSYFVRIETPFGPRTFFTDSTHVRLTGELRNADLTALPHVFIPGFPQAVTVAAVDSNYYDWFRTHNNRISGDGLINRVSGGIGVLGSLVRLRFQDFRVVTPQSEPAAGMYRFDGTQFEGSVTPYLSLELHVESFAARGDQGDALSGRYDRRPFLGMVGCATCGLLGSVRDGQIQLAFLTDWSARDTAEVMTGVIRGDTIFGSYLRQGGHVRFVKQ